MATESWVYMSDENAVFFIRLVKSGLLTISDNRIQYQSFHSKYIYAQSVFSRKNNQLNRKI